MGFFYTCRSSAHGDPILFVLVSDGDSGSNYGGVFLVFVFSGVGVFAGGGNAFGGGLLLLLLFFVVVVVLFVVVVILGGALVVVVGGGVFVVVLDGSDSG